MERDTREKIIQSVKKLYCKYDFENITTSMIIKDANISKGSLYWHFPSKEAIFETIFISCSEEMLAAARVGNDPDAPALEQLRMRQINMLHYVKEHPLEQHFVQKYEEYLLRNQKKTPSYVKSVNQESKDILQKGIERNELADFPLDFLIEYNKQKASFLNSYIIKHPDSMENPELLDTMIDRLLNVMQR